MAVAPLSWSQTTDACTVSYVCEVAVVLGAVSANRERLLRARPQLSFAEGLIQEEVGPLWEPWMRHVDEVLTDSHPECRAVWQREGLLGAARLAPSGPPSALSPLCCPEHLRAQADVIFRIDWRRERDSNPRRAFDPYTLSRGAPSTTRPPLRLGFKGPLINDLQAGRAISPL